MDGVRELIQLSYGKETMFFLRSISSFTFIKKQGQDKADVTCAIFFM